MYAKQTVPNSAKQTVQVSAQPTVVRQTEPMQSLPDRIFAFELGKLNQEQTVGLFQELVNTGMVWQLQSHFGREAMRLINAGLVKRKRLILNRVG